VTIESTAVARFVEGARRFCTWCESEPLEAQERTLAILLAELYAAGLHLPRPPRHCGYDYDAVPQPLEERILANVSSLGCGYYWRALEMDPLAEADSQMGMGDVSDDILDIYGEVRCGFLHFDAGRTEEAIMHWSSSLYIHWGTHATDALSALHRLSISKDVQ
jgi:hypothetical protein